MKKLIILTLLLCATSNSKISTEYQVKLKTNSLIGHQPSYIFSILELHLQKHVEISKSIKMTKVFNSTIHFIDKRTKVRSRCSLYDDDDITLKYDSPVLNELIYLTKHHKPNNETVKIEQDVYGKFSKFAISYTKDRRCDPIKNMSDIKYIFKNNQLLEEFDNHYPIKTSDTVYIRRYKGFNVIHKGSELSLVLDLVFPNEKSAYSDSLEELLSSELSFRVRSDKNKDLATKVFTLLLNNFPLADKGYMIKSPDYFY